jgi:hypothetical protein
LGAVTLEVLLFESDDSYVKVGLVALSNRFTGDTPCSTVFLARFAALSTPLIASTATFFRGLVYVLVPAILSLGGSFLEAELFAVVMALFTQFFEMLFYIEYCPT